MLDHTETVDPTDVAELRAPTNTEPATARSSSPLLDALDDDDISNDDSWAKPKKRSNKRLAYFTGALALALFGIGTFIAGAKIAGGSSTSTGSATGRGGAFGGLTGANGLPGGLGGAGGFGGLGGGGGGGGGNRRNARNATASGTATAAGSAALNDLINGATATDATPAIQGKVTAVDATSITVTKADGTTAVITLDNSSSLARRTAVTVTDIKVGDEVSANGVADTAGNVAATAVTVGDLPASADSGAESAPQTDDNLGGLLGG